ncbi:MAG: CBS domain-containing protein [Thermodesulfobacteriota bacterium]
MIVSNWMQPDPITIASDTSVVEAQRLVSENDLRILCVVDEGRLRGVLTRKNLNEAAQCVARTQNIHEVEYFVNRLKVKDLMNRMVKTVDAKDTVERVMLRGRRESVSTFPVMKEGKLVGLVSELEIFNSMIEVLGAEEHLQGLSLEPVEIEPGLLGRIAALSEGAGARLEALFTTRVEGTTKKKIILRFETDDLDRVKASLERAGYKVFEAEADTGAAKNNHRS